MSMRMKLDISFLKKSFVYLATPKGLLPHSLFLSVNEEQTRPIP